MAIAWVVKLGGSLARSEHLPPWLDALAAERVAVVPGGGPFADQVRGLQSHWHFDDRGAHRMAILAMAQYGTMLAAMQPRLKPASTPAAIRRLAAAAGAVWLPHPKVTPEAAIPASWDLTSDSLAAWLAGRIGARRLLLVKSAPLPESPASLTQLAAEGLVDPCFPRFAAAAGVEVWLAGPDTHVSLCAGLECPEGRFTPTAGATARS